MPKIVISGWYGWGNTGDDAMLNVLLTGLSKRLEGVCFKVLTESPQAVTAAYGPQVCVEGASHLSPYGLRKVCDPKRLRSTWRAWREVGTADLFVLGGGALIRDGNRSNFLRVMDELAVGEVLSVPTAAVGLTVGPVTTTWGRFWTTRLLERASILAVRDSSSRRALIDMGVTPEKIREMGDFALLFEGGRGPSGSDGLRIAICPCNAMLTGVHDGPRGNSELVAILAAVCRSLVRDFGASIDIVPFRRDSLGDDDLLLARQIRECALEVGDRVTIVVPRSVDDAWTAIGRSTMVIGARLHSLIFALAQGIPVVGVAYGQKVRGLLEDMGLNDFVFDPSDANAGNLLSCCRRVLESTDGFDSKVMERIAVRARQAERVMDDMAQLVSLGR
jgi:polysaccharide pyruvyl transferase WcaK-like protein